MPIIIPLQFKEQDILSGFAREFLSPNQDLWILRWNTLAAAYLKIQKSLKQLVRLPDLFAPQIIIAFEHKKYHTIYQRYAYLGRQISHARQSFETGLSLIGFQNISLLSIVDELLLENCKKTKSKRKGQKIENVLLQSALATFSKFQYNCRLSFMQGYFEVYEMQFLIEKEKLENHLKESHVRYKEENFLREILRSTSQYLNFEDLFKIFSQSLKEIGDYDRISVALKTEDPDETELIALSADKPSVLKLGTVVRNSLFTEVIKSKKNLINPDLSSLTKDEIAMSLVKEGILSSVIIPLMIGDEAIGTLNIASKKLNFFKESDLPFFQKLADGLAVAVKNACEHSKILENLKYQQCASEVISKIRASLNIEEVMETVCKELARCTNADRVFFAEIFEPQGVGTIDHEFLNPDSEMENLASAKGTYQIEDLKEAAELLRKGEVVAVNNEGEVHPLLRRIKDILDQLQVKTTCFVPVFVFQKGWGVIGIHHCANMYKWERIKIDLLKIIAKEVAKAIELAQIYQKEKETVKCLEKMLKPD